MNATESAAATRGVVYLHSAPSALCPHIEWALGGVFGTRVSLDWTAQGAQSGTYRAEYAWAGSPGSAAALTSAMRGWEQIRFEVTEDASPGFEGSRYAYTPKLGVFHATTGLYGDIMIPEDRLKAAIVKVASSGEPMLVELDRILGKPWDDELEPFRHAGDGAPVKWLHQVV